MAETSSSGPKRTRAIFTLFTIGEIIIKTAQPGGGEQSNYPKLCYFDGILVIALS
jgi:hypothetical protein